MVSRAGTPRAGGRAPRCALIALLALGTALALQPPGVAASTVPQAPASTGVPTTAGSPGDMPDEPTSLRISTFNLLGADHTAPGGNRSGWASGNQRMHWTVQLFNSHHIDVVGMQEMRTSQYDEFNKLTGSQFDIYPGSQAGSALKSNSIAWRSSQWQLVEAHTMKVYYFKDQVPMPYVLLRNRTTGREAWFYNSHNPADTRGNAQWRRNADVKREIGLVKRLRSADPDIPVFDTGDKNDRSQYICPMVTGSEMRAANGGGVSHGRCVMPSGTVPVDWITGSSDVRFSGYTALSNSLVRKTSDHRLVYADAFIPSQESEQSGVKHVVLVTVDGLRPSAIEETGTKGTPQLHRMISSGASTLNARTDYRSVNKLSNAASMLTGRNVPPSAGGHGAGWPRRPQSTLRASAGHYVSSVLGVTHDFGHHTAVVTSDPATRIVQHSYDSKHGATDPYEPNNGRSKISHFVLARDNATVVRRTIDLIKGDDPAFTFVQLDWAATQGARFGWHSQRYHQAVTISDRRVHQIVSAIDSTPGAANHTVVIVTAERGGSRAKGSDVSQFTWYRVPVIATGPGVAQGANLYDLNPQLHGPAHRRTSYAGTQPIRTSYLANLATRLLGEPPIPGANRDPGQELSVFPAA
ncbi:MAG: alkaline phosphatase family protein [Marmoricola sp.]